jgi:hypothetical protein
MVRQLVGLLVLLNALYWAWAQGWLLPYGFGPMPQNEPQRLTQQIRPTAIKLLSPAEVKLLSRSGSSDNALCLQSGLMDEIKAAAVRAYLETSWPADSWVFEAAPGLRLRLPAVNTALQAQLPELKAVLPLGMLEPCTEPTTQP